MVVQTALNQLRRKKNTERSKVLLAQLQYEHPEKSRDIPAKRKWGRQKEGLK